LLATGLGVAALVELDLFQLGSQLISAFPNDPIRARDLELFLLEMIFSKADVRPGRLLASVVLFTFLYLLVTVAWQPIHRALGWLLIPLGQNALYAYTAHVVLALPIALIMHTVWVPEAWVGTQTAMAQAASVLAIWVLIRRRVLFISPTQGKARYLLPLGAAFGCL